MYERRHDVLLSRADFARRLIRHGAVALGILSACLAIGMAGYHHFEGMGLVDSFLNASMILSGMGPVATLQTVGGKIFAGCYGLFSGAIFLTTFGIVLSPIFHRAIHKFHRDSAPSGKRSAK
jgi:hypothetical protein